MAELLRQGLPEEGYPVTAARRIRTRPNQTPVLMPTARDATSYVVEGIPAEPIR